jgi:acyl-CoA thioester hydrolase
MLQSSTQITVRYAETDMMGIVYHGNYLPWFEVGRTNLLKEFGVPYRELEKEGTGEISPSGSVRRHRHHRHDPA